MTIINYEIPPQTVVGESTKTYVVTITPALVPTVESYNYFSQTVSVESIVQNNVVVEKNFVTAITIN